MFLCTVLQNLPGVLSIFDFVGQFRQLVGPRWLHSPSFPSRQPPRNATLARFITPQRNSRRDPAQISAAMFPAEHSCHTPKITCPLRRNSSASRENAKNRRPNGEKTQSLATKTCSHCRVPVEHRCSMFNREEKRKVPSEIGIVPQKPLGAPLAPPVISRQQPLCAHPSSCQNRGSHDRRATQ
jgi:hypothetical protein